MDSSSLTNYSIAAAVILFFGWKKWRLSKMKPLIGDFLRDGAVIVDVRNLEEFQGGHCDGSINIPLGSLSSRIHELDKKGKIIVCCASGVRSGSALSILKSNGFQNVINAGPWTNAVITK
jgi:rhodanese-related sulfurtransferase